MIVLYCVAAGLAAPLILGLLFARAAPTDVAPDGDELRLAAEVLRLARASPAAAWRVVWACCTSARRRIATLRALDRAAQARGRESTARQLDALAWELWRLTGVSAWVLRMHRWDRLHELEAAMLRVEAQLRAALRPA